MCLAIKSYIAPGKITDKVCQLFIDQFYLGVIPVSLELV